MSLHRRRMRYTCSIAATIALVAGVLVALAPTASAAKNTCRATNLTQATPTRANLQRVIDDANTGDTIQVKRVCVGTFTISTDLTIVGAKTKAVRKPKLTADRAGTTLTVEANVTLRNLTVTGGLLSCATVSCTIGGAGIQLNSPGSLTLKGGVVVRGNELSCSGDGCDAEGAGIYNNTTGAGLTLTKNASVRANVVSCDGVNFCYADGAGISTGIAPVTLTGSASVVDNQATCSTAGCSVQGVGIYGASGAITLMGSSSVSGNVGRCSADSCYVAGGGIDSEFGSLTMTGSSSVAGNAVRCPTDSCTARGGGFESSNGTALFKGSASLSQNKATCTGVSCVAYGGGIFAHAGSVQGCDASGVDEWVGTVEPNNPNDFLDTDVSAIPC